MAEKVPGLKIAISDTETGDVVETLYTNAPLLELIDILGQAAVMFDTQEQLAAAATEENDRG